MHIINHSDFELPAEKVKSQNIHSQGQEAGDAFEKVSLLSGLKEIMKNNCWKCSFYLACFLVPSSHGSKICPWGCAEKVQSLLVMTAPWLGEDGSGVSSTWTQHIMVLLHSYLSVPFMSYHKQQPTCLPQVHGIQFIFSESQYSILHL